MQREIKEWLKYAHMNPPTTRWRYFKVIQSQKILWYCGGAIVDYARSFWHLHVMKRSPLWPEADASRCSLLICRYCGRTFLV